MNDTNDTQTINNPNPGTPAPGNNSAQAAQVPNLDALMGGGGVSSWMPQDQTPNAIPSHPPEMPKNASDESHASSVVIPTAAEASPPSSPAPTPFIETKNNHTNTPLQSGNGGVPKKSSLRRTLTGLVVLLLLIVSVPTGIYFVSQRNQILDIRNKAAGEEAHLTLSPQTSTITSDQPFDIQLRVNSNTPIYAIQLLMRISGSAEVTADDVTIPSLRTAVLNAANTSITFFTTAASPTIPFIPQGDDPILTITIIPHGDVTLSYEGSTIVLASTTFANMLVSPENGVYTISSDTTTPTSTPILATTATTTVTPTPTTSGSTNTPTPTPATNQCTDIHVYKEGQSVTDLSSLQPGDSVEFGVFAPSGATAARLSINGATFTESANKNTAGEYVFPYTFPSSGTINFSVQSQTQVNGVWR